MEVLDYINQEMVKPYRDGETDCCNTADRWVAACRGFSPLARFGRPVRCAQDVERWLAERWGIIGGVLRVMRASGLPRTNEPVAGDVGLVIIKKEACMAIFTGKMWFARNEHGAMLANRDSFIRVWSV